MTGQQHAKTRPGVRVEHARQEWPTWSVQHEPSKAAPRVMLGHEEAPPPIEPIEPLHRPRVKEAPPPIEPIEPLHRPRVKEAPPPPLESRAHDTREAFGGQGAQCSITHSHTHKVLYRNSYRCCIATCVCVWVLYRNSTCLVSHVCCIHV
jgi:hypothetical protein